MTVHSESRLTSGVCIALEDGRSHHVAYSLCAEEDAYLEMSLRLRNGSIRSMGVFYPTGCRVLECLNRHYSATDNYYLKDLTLARGVVPSCDLLCFAFDKLKASGLAPQDSVEPGWLATQSCWLKAFAAKLRTLIIYNRTVG